MHARTYVRFCHRNIETDTPACHVTAILVSNCWMLYEWLKSYQYLTSLTWISMVCCCPVTDLQLAALSLRSTENCLFQYLPHVFSALTSASLDLAQLVEHTTVTVTQSLYGRWFDSGSRDDRFFFTENYFFAQKRTFPVADSFESMQCRIVRSTITSLSSWSESLRSR